MSSPPVTVLQVVPSVSPICAQVRWIMLLDETVFPGNERYWAAMLRALLLRYRTEMFHTSPEPYSRKKGCFQLKCEILFSRSAPRLPPYWLKRPSSRLVLVPRACQDYSTGRSMLICVQPGRDALKMRCMKLVAPSFGDHLNLCTMKRVLRVVTVETTFIVSTESSLGVITDVPPHTALTVLIPSMLILLCSYCPPAL